MSDSRGTGRRRSIRSSRPRARSSMRTGSGARVWRRGGIACSCWDLRGPGLGARHRVAGGRFVEHPPLSGSGAGRVAAGSFDGVSHAALDGCGDARPGVHLGPVWPTPGPNDWHRCDDAGSQRGLAEHRAPRHGRELQRVSEPPGGGVGHRDAHTGRAREVAGGRPTTVDAPARPRDEGWPDPSGP